MDKVNDDDNSLINSSNNCLEQGFFSTCGACTLRGMRNVLGGMWQRSFNPIHMLIYLIRGSIGYCTKNIIFFKKGVVFEKGPGPPALEQQNVTRYNKKNDILRVGRSRFSIPPILGLWYQYRVSYAER